MDITQMLIAFSVVMLMLSIITERLANFIKLYFQDKTIYIFYPHKVKQGRKWWLSAKIGLLSFRQPSAGGEKKREFRILTINIIVGILVATLANANLFQILPQFYQNTPEKAVIGWNVEVFQGGNLWPIVIGAIYLLSVLWAISLVLFKDLEEYRDKEAYSIQGLALVLKLLVFGTILFLFVVAKWFDEGQLFSSCKTVLGHSIGFVSTGIFLSLGSKFWHDLLDILFSFKNTRQRLSEKETYTNYHSADSILALAETPQYNVAQKLYDKYQSEIIALEGVVSCCLKTDVDERSRLYRKQIEIEFTSSVAQQKLMKIAEKGSIVIIENTFFLKDYLKLMYTSSLIALPSPAGHPNIVDTSPICYAFNKKSPNIRGSFGLEKRNNEYIAISNLHVFASAEDFKLIGSDPSHELQHLDVEFNISDKPFLGKIDPDSAKFGPRGTMGRDECICKVSKAAFDAFQETVEQAKTLPKNHHDMRMFGAFSKYAKFHPFRTPAFCRVRYKGFVKELNLIKIHVSSSHIDNVSKGDSGSVIYYHTIEENNKPVLRRGLLVAKSDNCAYMTELFNKI